MKVGGKVWISCELSKRRIKDWLDINSLYKNGKRNEKKREPKPEKTWKRGRKAGGINPLTLALTPIPWILSESLQIRYKIEQKWVKR